MNAIIQKFLADNPQFSAVEWDQGDVTVYYRDEKNGPVGEPWGIHEFEIGSPTRLLLEDLEAALFEAEEKKDGRQRSPESTG